MVDIENDDDIKGLEHRDRKGILKALDKAVDKALEKVQSGRVYNPQNEKVRIRWLKALSYTCDIYRKVKKEEEINELEERIEQLEKEG